MSDFVDECRQEWKRLGVADAVANEMAADLAADLEEAEAEGVSAEEVLGSAVFDPRSFAMSWATERGVVPQAPAPGGGAVVAPERPTRVRMLAAVAASAVAAFIGLALLARASRSAGFIGSVHKVVPAPLFGPRAGIKFPMFVTHSHGPELAHGIGVVLLLVAFAGLIAATIYWSRRARTNH